MLKPQRVIACFWLIGLFCLSVAAQDVAREKSAPMALDLVAIGHGKTTNGHWTISRTYKASDGTKGQITYTEFDSLQAAQQQIEDWIKPTRKITSREQNQRKGGQLIDDRIFAVAVLPKSDKEEFVIIRRESLKCYVIESVSLQIAIQIEDLIDYK